MSCALLSFVALALAPLQGAPRTLSLPLAQGERAVEALFADVDGDGRSDLVVAVVTPRGRELRAHRGLAAPALFDATSLWRLELSGDVVAVHAARVTAEPRDVPVLFSRSGAFAALPWIEGQGRFARLAEAPLIWQLADDADVPFFAQGVVDLDGDGRPDLLLPTATGYRAFVQRTKGERVEFVAAGEPTLPDGARLALERGLPPTPDAPSAAERGFRVRVAISGDAARPTSLLTVSDSVPAPVYLRTERGRPVAVAALDDRFLHLWRVAADGTFATDPTNSVVSPVEMDARRKLDISYVVTCGDVDGDGRDDVVIVAADQRSKDVRTQVMVYPNKGGDAPLFGDAGRPAQVLVLAGFVGNVRLDDVDGDGRPDLVATSVRPDLLEALRQATSDRVEAELYVYKNENGRFARRPAMTRRLRFQVQDADPVVRFVASGAARGPASLLLREEPNSVALFPLRSERDGTLATLPQPAWRIGLNPRSELKLWALSGALPDTLVALEPNQVLVARWP